VDPLEKAVDELTRRVRNFDKVYGACADARCHFNVETGEGSLDDLIRFAVD